MSKQGIFAGARVRRIRRDQRLTQSAMADMIGISDSYLALIEGNRRPLTAALMLRLAELFDFDIRTLSDAEPGGGAAGLRRRLADPLFADIRIDRAEVEAWLGEAPGAAEAFARLFDRWREGGPAEGDAGANAAGFDVVGAVRREIDRWRNHFADLDSAAEALADEIRLGSGDLYGAIADRLRVRHQLSIRILPVDVFPDQLRRLDLHARQLQLSELLDPAARTFQAAFQLGSIEAREEIDALVRGASFPDRTAERLFRRYVTSYFAAALIMPYGRFLRACEATGYDVELLRHRFGAGFEQVAHRLTTLQRVGSRGLPFFLIRVDRAGQVSKRYAGASGAALVEASRCPLWVIHRAFDQPGRLMWQLAELEDGARWFTMARTSIRHGHVAGALPAEFALGLGLAAEAAAGLAMARGVDLAGGQAEPIGLGCRQCQRLACVQRSAPPAGRVLTMSDRERGITPFPFGEN